MDLSASLHQIRKWRFNGKKEPRIKMRSSGNPALSLISAWTIIRCLVTMSIRGSTVDLLPSPVAGKSSECYKILLISPICAKSHNHMYSVLAAALAARCHTVTMLISYPTNDDVPGVRQLTSPTYQALSEEVFLYRHKKMAPFTVSDTIKGVWNKMHVSPSICERFLADPLTQSMLGDDTEKYDYILFSPHLVEECALAIVHHHRKKYNTPWGFIFSSTVFPWTDEAMGNPALSSTYPVQLMDFGDRMSFSQRAMNMAFTTFFLWSRLYWSYPRVEAMLRRDYDPEVGSLAALEKTSSMFLVNVDDSVFFYPHARTPQTILVACLHCRAPKPLPKDLDDWMNGSGDHGVVLFSLGSFLKGHDFREEDQEEFIRAFSKLKQRVLWKWDGPTIPNLPKNVELMKWLPQQDVLGHPKCKAFITHGGMMGTQEASYHGVPMVGFAMGADQHLNLVKTVADGAGIKLEWNSYTSDAIVVAVKKVIDDPSYKQNVLKRKELIEDQPETPLDRAVWWVEYMARHDGADHLRPAVRDLEWYQVYMLDVWVLLATVFAIIMAIPYLACRLCWSLLARRRRRRMEMMSRYAAEKKGVLRPTKKRD